MSSPGRSFDSVADLYDDVRPRYPDKLYDAVDEAVGGLSGRDILDLAAGTGIATRALRSRGARAIALDPGEAMLSRLVAVSPGVPVVAASAEQLPFHCGAFDVVTCATAWHWLDAGRTVDEVRRVVRPGGYLVLWWGVNAWGDSVEWEDAQSAVFDRWDSVRGSVPVLSAGVPPREAAADLRARGLSVVVDEEVTWSRDVTRDEHMQMLRTHSNNLARSKPEREAILAEIKEALAPWPRMTERLWGPLIVARI